MNFRFECKFSATALYPYMDAMHAHDPYKVTRPRLQAKSIGLLNDI